MATKKNAGNVALAQELDALANNLAANSRRVRALASDAEAHESALAALQAASSAAFDERQAARDEVKRHARSVLDPLVDEAREAMRLNAAARKEAAALVEQMTSLDRKAVFQRIPNTMVSAHSSTHDLLGLAFRIAGELADLLRATDGDLRDAITAGERVDDVTTPQGRYALSALQHWLPRSGAASEVTRKLVALKKLLADSGAAATATPAAPAAEPVEVRK
jgi:hypothetical protein